MSKTTDKFWIGPKNKNFKLAFSYKEMEEIIASAKADQKSEDYRKFREMIPNKWDVDYKDDVSEDLVQLFREKMERGRLVSRFVLKKEKVKKKITP